MTKQFSFAKRTEWCLATNILSQTLEGLKKKNIAVLDLTVSNPTQSQFKYPTGKILNALGSTANLTYEPSPSGLLSARQEVARYYQAKGCKVPVEHIVLTSSTSEGYSFVFRLLADSGDSILFPKPSYPLFDFLGDLNDIHLGSYFLRYKRGQSPCGDSPLLGDRWAIDMDSLRGAVTSRTKAIVLVNPNNPTGSFVSASELKEINALCAERNIALICDEVFLDYRLDGYSSHDSLVGNKDVLTFVLSGISKILGLPQMKLSWIVASGPSDVAEEALKRLEVITDTYLSVSTPIQNALPKWMALMPGIQKHIQARIKSNATFLKKILKDSAVCEALNIQGGWYAVLRVKRGLSPQGDCPLLVDEEKFVVNLLETQHVFVHPGYFFDFEESGFLVVSLLTPEKVFQEGIKKILNEIRR
jgi:alanine-synthesizing transaminase